MTAEIAAVAAGRTDPRPAQRPAGAARFRPSGDRVTLSPMAQALQSAEREAAGRAASQAGQAYQKLMQAVKLAAAKGDAPGLRALAGQAEKLAAQVSALIAGQTDEAQRRSLEDLLDLIRALAASADRSADAAERDPEAATHPATVIGKLASLIASGSGDAPQV